MNTSLQTDIRIPSVRQHLLRIFGINRSASLYGVDGDRIAAEFAASVHSGCTEPIFMLQGQCNRGWAYVILCATGLAAWLTMSIFINRGAAISQMVTVAYKQSPSTCSQVAAYTSAQAPQFRLKPPNPYNPKGPQQQRMQICTQR
jgi:hypothetical protein